MLNPLSDLLFFHACLHLIGPARTVHQRKGTGRADKIPTHGRMVSWTDLPVLDATALTSPRS